MSGLQVKKITGESVSINMDSLNQFKKGFNGNLLFENDSEYNESRNLWNEMIDKKPAIIIKCNNTSDIQKSVQFANDNDILLSIKGGGHNVAGNAVNDGGMMIDLSPMKSVTVNKENSTVRVESGCLLGDVDLETQKYGLAVSAGIVSHTGVAGLALGGGFGWISRKFGFSVDNLISAEVITADGQIFTASREENEDLFWGIRGGGGNFGIISSFEFKCAKIGTELFSGMAVHPFENAKEYIIFHQEYVRTLPDELTVWMVIRKAPPLPFLPEDVHGKLVVVVPFVYVGSQAEGEKLMKPLFEFGTPHAAVSAMHKWTDWQTGFDALNAHGARNYWKSHHLKELSSESINKIIKFAEKMPSPHCEIFIPHMEGAPSRVPKNETAFAHRSTPFALSIHTRWEEAKDDEKCIKWAKDFFEETKPFAKGVYVNFLSDEGEERVKDAYTEEVWNRLVQLKNKYDPKNLFQMNQNIQPTV